MNAGNASPRVTIIVATYNSERDIDACLESVCCQTFRDLEIWVVDGASKDGTLEKIRERAARDPRIHWLSEKDRGVYDAMNKGVTRAKGAWVFFLGSDDRLANEHVLAEMSPHLDAAACDFVHADIVWRNDGWGRDGQAYGGELSTAEILEKNYCHQAIFYARTIFDRFGGYNLDYRVLADWEFNLRVFAKVRKKYVNQVVADVFGGGLSQSVSDYAFDRDFVKLASSALGLLPKSPAFRNRNNKIKQTFKAHFRARRFKQGWRYLKIWLADEDPAVFRAILFRRFGAKRSEG